MSREPLKIGFVFDDSLDRNDGVQQYVRTLGQWLDDRGHTVRYLVGETHDAGPQQPQVHSLARNVKVSGNRNRMSIPLPANKTHIRQVLREERFDVLHVQMPYSPLMSGRVMRESHSDTAVVGTFHIVAEGLPERIGSRLLGIWQWRSKQRFDTVMAASTAAQSFCKEYFYLDSTVVPNMVDIERYRKAKPVKSLQGKNGTVVFVGRLVQRKGGMQLLHSFKVLHDKSKLDGVNIHIAGDGPDRANMEQFVRDNALPVNFHGFVSEDKKARLMASASVSVFPSLYGESFGIVLVEAMACGNSVVLAGDNQGYKTVVSRPAQQINPLDPIASAAKIDGYLRHAKRRQAALAWQNKRLKKFDVELVGPRIESIYERAVRTRVAQANPNSHT